ncbi:MAG: hypothetical protein J0J01_06380 [Reyranella sp.]|uniref:hypothetical protein n=1 Tax=Reyranella sp. TaxID=1929291 RepID=UPI001ACE3E02|nr:hypothetical protein [Reyranella sp.]MBN9086516.1 hypothetical protein [Reyranella sp.]
MQSITVGRGVVVTIERLREEVRDVVGWLDLKMRTGKYSFGLVLELAQHGLTRSYSVHAIYDEIGILEASDSRPSATKPATPFLRPPLTGLWHKHHFQPRFLPKNLCLELSRPGAMEEIFAPLNGQYVSDVADRLAFETVIGSYSKRATQGRLTGEFIVYEQRPDGSNYYLTLGGHGEYDAIRERVDAYREYDEEIKRDNQDGKS